jgi:hypothetical protein
MVWQLPSLDLFCGWIQHTHSALGYFSPVDFELQNN